MFKLIYKNRKIPKTAMCYIEAAQLAVRLRVTSCGYTTEKVLSNDSFMMITLLAAQNWNRSELKFYDILQTNLSLFYLV